MDWLAPIIAALLGGLLTGNVWSFLRLRGRIRSRLSHEVAILDRLDRGRARDALSAHVNRQVLELVAEQEGFTLGERRRMRDALSSLFAGMLIFFLPFVSSVPGWLVVLGVVMALMYWLIAFFLARAPLRDRASRRKVSRAEADDLRK